MTDVNKKGFQSRCILVSHVFRLAMVFFLVVAISIDNLSWTLICISGVVVSAVPIFLKRYLKIEIPGVLDLLITLALLLHTGVVGVFDNIYHILPEFDLVTHFVSSVLVAFIALIALYLLNEYWDGLHLNIYTMAFAAVVITMALGVVWELGEWTIGKLCGIYFQVGLDDTMIDLLVDTTGATVMAVTGIYLIKKGSMKEMTRGLGKLVDLLQNKMR